MTGRGEGYCALVLPPPGTGEVPYGYAGLQGVPVRLGPSVALPAFGTRFARWVPLAIRPMRKFGRGMGRGRGRWFVRW